LTRLPKPQGDDTFDSELSVEILFNDDLVVAAGVHSRWARRRKINLSELVEAPWILAPAGALSLEVFAEAFRSAKLAVPKMRLSTFSIHLRTHLLATSDFLAVIPRSVLRLNAAPFGLKALPVKLPVRDFLVAVVTLKKRTLSPVAELFLHYVRSFVQTIDASR